MAISVGAMQKVVLVILPYLTLDESLDAFCSFHMVFFNHLQGNQMMNISMFLFKSMEKSVFVV